MRLHLYFVLFLFLNCQSQIAGHKEVSAKKQIPFEDKNHYPFALTPNDFLIIDSQEKMDKVFRIIHRHINGNRLPPIPAVTEHETYLIIKPVLKETNDVSLESVMLDQDILYVKVKAFENPDFDKRSRFAPDILIKLTGKISFKKLSIKYLP